MDLKRRNLESASHMLPGCPLIEIAGERRVLVENHNGVIEYGGNRICVRVKYGHVSIHGEGLQIAKMTAEQLVICGKIDGVDLFRRKGN